VISFIRVEGKEPSALSKSHTHTHKDMPAAPTEPMAQHSEPGQAAPPELDSSGLREQLEAVKAELAARDKRLDDVTRAYSSLLNDQKEFRVRLEREKERVLDTERGKIALHLLQVADDLERALGAARGDEGPLAQGVRLIHEGVGRTIGSLGLERLSLVGQPFDPNLAEVVDVVPTPDAEADGRVLSEVVPGWRLGERLLRPARVRVSRHVPAQPQ
jgi:molecular chaperone GrpE